MVMKSIAHRFSTVTHILSTNMRNYLISGLLFSAVLTGAGCSSVASTPNIKITQPVQTFSVPVSSPPSNQVASCTKTGTVTSTASADLLSHDILLDGQKISTVKTEGPVDVEKIMPFPGIAVLAFQYNGIGGYIPFLSYPYFYTVNPCTKEVQKLSPPAGIEARLYTVSPDGSMVVYAGSGHIGILSTGLKPIPYESPSQWLVVDEAAGPLLGDFVFNSDNTKLAFATGDGPENEHGAVFILDLSTGKITRVATNPSGIMHVKGWKEDGSGVDYSDQVPDAK